MPVVHWRDDAHVAAQVPHSSPTESQAVPFEHSAKDTQAQGSEATPSEMAPSASHTQPAKWVANEDAAEWNSLLTWARRQRGPQWDTGTGMYVVAQRAHADGKFHTGVTYIMGMHVPPTPNAAFRCATMAT